MISWQDPLADQAWRHTRWLCWVAPHSCVVHIDLFIESAVCDVVWIRHLCVEFRHNRWYSAHGDHGSDVRLIVRVGSVGNIVCWRPRGDARCIHFADVRCDCGGWTNLDRIVSRSLLCHVRGSHAVAVYLANMSALEKLPQCVCSWKRSLALNLAPSTTF